MLATLLVALVAIIHLAILVLEMFLWEAPAGRRAFNLSADFARETRVLAANQGLYNGFLAAGLAWGLWLGAPGVQVVIFFLACVLAAAKFSIFRRCPHCWRCLPWWRKRRALIQNRESRR